MSIRRVLLLKCVRGGGRDRTLVGRDVYTRGDGVKLLKLLDNPRCKSLITGPWKQVPV